MRLSTLHQRRFLLVALALGGLACAESFSAGPEEEAPPGFLVGQPLFDHRAYADTFAVTPLGADTRDAYSASVELHPNRGAVLEIPETGLTVIFPRRSVRERVRVTVTAIPGPYIMYDFQPHGLRFENWVIVKQSLKGTTAYANPAVADQIGAAYFPTETPQIDPATGAVSVVELQPSLPDFTRTKLFWGIQHFSGYMVASGVRSAPTFR